MMTAWVNGSNDGYE